MPEKFVLELNLNDWNTLTEVAEANGFKNYREFITSQMMELKRLGKVKKICSGQRRKKKNNYTIPEGCEEFYKNLACLHSTNVSAVIFRYIILPNLITRQQFKNKKIFVKYFEDKQCKKPIIQSALQWPILPPLV